MPPKRGPELPEKIRALPRAPGIYLMKDRRRQVIYVGKAKDLRARVRNYYQKGGDDGRLITRQIDEVADIDVVVADSEKEALILENNFIKQFLPKYNVCFRDDKSFVSIKIPLRQKWPRPTITRNLSDKDALYFGPYASAKAARATLRVLQDTFPLRKCSVRQCREAKRPCLYGQMGKCLAPCCAEVTAEDYERLVEQVTMFLKGKGGDLLDALGEQMNAASQRRDYEKAARLRDRVRAIKTTLEKQRVGASAGETDRDVFGLAVTDRSVWVAVLFVRRGNLQDVGTYRFAASLGAPEGVFASFLNQFYAANRFIPREVLLPVPSEDAEVLAQWLSEKRARKVSVVCPQRGEKKKLVELACRNAGEAQRISTSDEEKHRAEAESLSELLGLERPPHSIECFDISNLSGREAVGSMVVFRDGEPDKSSYRHYRIREVEGQDDFAMMHEVLTRRYRRTAAQQAAGEGAELPDLVVVDGGKGQLSAALGALAALGVEDAAVVALAKARSGRGGRAKHERVFLRGAPQPVVLPIQSYGLRLITRVRDEAHRFAVSYHRKLRRKAALASPLTAVPGVGRRIADRLVAHFGSLAAVARAGEEQLSAVRGVSERLARAIRAHLGA